MKATGRRQTLGTKDMGGPEDRLNITICTAPIPSELTVGSDMENRTGVRELHYL
jgi:hypothetical protein